MKEFAAEHCRIIYQMVILITILVLLFSTTQNAQGKTGLISILGEQAVTVQKDVSESKDFAIITDVSQAEKPEITAENNRTYYTGTAYSVKDLFRAWDMDKNQELECSILSIEEVYDETDYLESFYNEEQGKINFEVPGVYRITVCTADHNRKTVREAFQFAVNQN